jgi:hypothetical protein
MSDETFLDDLLYPPQVDKPPWLDALTAGDHHDDPLLAYADKVPLSFPADVDDKHPIDVAWPIIAQTAMVRREQPLRAIQYFIAVDRPSRAWTERKVLLGSDGDDPCFIIIRHERSEGGGRVYQGSSGSELDPLLTIINRNMTNLLHRIGYLPLPATGPLRLNRALVVGGLQAVLEAHNLTPLPVSPLS